MKIVKIVAANMRKLRNHHSYSLKHIQVRTGLNYSRLSKMETGSINIPLSVLEALSKLYRIDILMFFVDTSDSNELLRWKNLIKKNIKIGLTVQDIEDLLNSHSQ